MVPPGFQDLVRRAQDGDRAAMDRVLEILRPQLEPMARPYADPGRPVESTADLLQEACLRAWRKIDLFRQGEDDEETFRLFRAWIGQIVRRLSFTAGLAEGRERAWRAEMDFLLLVGTSKIAPRGVRIMTTLSRAARRGSGCLTRAESGPLDQGESRHASDRDSSRAKARAMTPLRRKQRG